MALDCQTSLLNVLWNDTYIKKSYRQPEQNIDTHEWHLQSIEKGQILAFPRIVSANAWSTQSSLSHTDPSEGLNQT